MNRFTGKLLASCVLCGVLCLAPLTARGALIEVGDIVLQANQAGQVVTFKITGGEQIAGANFYAQVGDGGPELADLDLSPNPPLEPGTDGPGMTIDLTSGIFSGNSSGQTDLLDTYGGSIPQLAAYSIVTNSGTIAADGDLVTITFDTTGFDSGTWIFSLVDTHVGATELLDSTGINPIDLVVTAGSITVVPEPTSVLLLFSGLAVGGVVFLRRRRGAGSSRN